MNDISMIQAKEISVLRSRRIIPLRLKIAQKRTFFVWKLTLSAIFRKPPKKYFKPRMVYVRLVFHQAEYIRLNF